jgi:uncharacterized membrane protein YbhN (UPF0104 family)
MTDKHQSPWVVWGTRLLTLFFLILVPALLYLLARNLDWNEVHTSLRAYSTVTLAVGAALAFASYMVFSIFDLIGRAYTGHHLPARQVIPVAFVCYAFNLNFTTWVGGVALRYRLYSRLGLDTATVTRIISLGILTNWIGYMALAGVVFSLRLVKLPESWSLGVTGLQLIGFLLLALAGSYLFACGYAKRRTWSWRDHEITLPSLRLALIQVWLGAINWALMASLIFWLLPHGHGTYYPSILGILLISCVAGHHPHPRRPRGAGSGLPRPAPRPAQPGQPGGRAAGLPHPVLPAAADSGGDRLPDPRKTRQDHSPPPQAQGQAGT